MAGRRLAIIGGGGHALVVLEAALAAGLDVAGFFDDQEAPGLEARAARLGSIADCAASDGGLILGIGGLGARRLLIDSLEDASWTSVVHPSAQVSASAQIGPGAYVGAGVIVNGRARVAPHAILNTGCIVEHDCEIGANVHVGPRAVLGGGVRVGDDTLVGIGATVLPLVRIGVGCVISGGGAAAHDIPDRTTAIGVPARPVRGGGGASG